MTVSNIYTLVSNTSVLLKKLYDRRKRNKRLKICSSVLISRFKHDIVKILNIYTMLSCTQL